MARFAGRGRRPHRLGVVAAVHSVVQSVTAADRYNSARRTRAPTFSKNPFTSFTSLHLHNNRSMASRTTFSSAGDHSTTAVELQLTGVVVAAVVVVIAWHVNALRTIVPTRSKKSPILSTSLHCPKALSIPSIIFFRSQGDHSSTDAGLAAATATTASEDVPVSLSQSRDAMSHKSFRPYDPVLFGSMSYSATAEDEAKKQV